MNSVAPPPLGMLVKIWPKLSETFILEEVLGLQRRGVPLRLYALSPPTDEIHHPVVETVSAPLVCVPPLSRAHLPAHVRAHLRCLLRSPWRWLSTAVRAARRGPQGTAAFARAAWFGQRLREDGVPHLHVHFISTTADMAELACAMVALPFSISAHAKDIYTSGTEDLRRKLLAARFTVTCTEANREVLARAAPAAVVHRMYHGIDHGVFHPSQREAPAGAPPLILAVGRLRAKKGLDTLIGACEVLRSRQRDFRCEIVGYGEEQAALARRIAEAGLQDRVRLLGKLARADVLRCYARAAVFVQPSRITADGDRDGIPNVLLEAMAMGLPVVASEVSGIPELVRHGVNGLLVPPDGAEVLADAIAALLDDPGRAARLGQSARASVQASFDNDHNLQVLTGLLGQDSHEACCAHA